ncbi:hypothetical protein ASF24_13820 [Methylobacterium sp. Leaf86]|uniref:phage tail tape measure protein n=1 Tax=Methylobacterium sp. Leaf86 TaxID=1736242 RepID=UPI0006F78DDE|nr:phage tail tape measure protein [Methylobacterium sp. Leaf86]KQO59233.1 hypothetical protein ASF24_13820 [Methylobacterium sp. Leaf86]
MIVEELVARLGFKASGSSDVRKFLADLKKTRDELKQLQSASKEMKFSFGRAAYRDLDRATASAKSYRRELERASRVRPGRSERGGGRIGADYSPGHSVAERIPHRSGPRGSVTGGVVAGNLITSVVRDAAKVVVKPLITFANEETARKQLSLTAGVPEDQVAKDFEEFRRVAPDLGVAPKKMLEVINGYVAAGLTYEQGKAAAIPTVKTAKAGFANVDDVTKSGIAAINNLAIPAEKLGAAFDIMLTSGKSGEIELKDLANVLPETAAAAQNAGYKDLEGLTKLTAQLQFAKKGTSSAGEAATNASNYFGKVFAEVTIKAFKEAGIDIVKKIKENEKNGVNASDTVLAEAEKYSKGDPFKMKELFGDVQAGAFLQQALKHKDAIAANIAEVNKTAPGSVDADFKAVMDRLAGSVERFSAAVDRLAGRSGEAGSAVAKQVVDESTGILKTVEDIWVRLRKGVQPAASPVEDMDKRLRELNGVADPPDPSAPKPAPKLQPKLDPAPIARPDFLAEREAKNNALLRGSFSPGFGKVAAMPTMTMPQLGAPEQRMDWTKRGAEKAGDTITNNTDTGNDHRTQTVNIHQTVNDQAQVAQAAATAAKNAISSMGASIVKGSTASTGASTAP